MKDMQFWRNLLNQENKKGNCKFISEPQILQFLVKKYCEKFYKEYDPQDFYKAWKQKKGVKSSCDFGEKDLENYILSFSSALDFNLK